MLAYLPVYAFSLGNVKVNSFINQNLDAEIEISSSNKIQVEKIKAFLASKKDFNKFDLERETYLNDIRFVTYQEESGRAYIHLTSTKIIREPLVSLVITLRSLEGNISREYNLFLNPSPDTRIQSVPKANLISVNKLDRTFQQSHNQEKSNKKVNVAAKQKDSYAVSSVYRPDLNYLAENYQTVSSYGPINPGDLLTMIAQEIRPDDTYAVQKIAKLLYQYNPDAFTNGDINKLKVGHTLKVPGLNKPEFRKDSLAYLDNGNNQQQLAETQLTSNNQPDGKLTLLSDEPQEKYIEGNTQQLLRVSMDKVDTLTVENNILQEQFDLLMERMEEVINNNDVLNKELKKFRTAEMNFELKKIDAEEEISNDQLISKDKEIETITATEDVVLNNENTVPVEKIELSIDEQSINNEIEKKKEAALVNIENKSVQSGVSEIDWLYWILLVSGIFALLLFALVIIVKLKLKKTTVNEEFSLDNVMDNSHATDQQKRNQQSADVNLKQESDVTDTITMQSSTTQEQGMIYESDRVEPGSDLTDIEFSDTKKEENLNFDLELDEPNPLEDNAQLSDSTSSNVQHSQHDEDENSEIKTGAVQQVSNKVASNSSVSSPGVNFNDILGPAKSSQSTDNVDLLSQSSVYFAYGKFDLAEQLLSDGIESDSDNIKLKLKLFECYSKMDDETKFMSYLEQEKELYRQDNDFNDKLKNMYLKQWNKELF
ncbi:MAG: hypothetical protein QM504_12480 [Pseudomonadota bacterium]